MERFLLNSNRKTGFKEQLFDSCKLNERGGKPYSRNTLEVFLLNNPIFLRRLIKVSWIDVDIRR